MIYCGIVRMPKMQPMELVLILEHSCNYLNSGKHILVFQIYKTNKTKANQLSYKKVVKGFWQEFIFLYINNIPLLALMSAVDVLMQKSLNVT